ncbi:MAG: acetylglutamate kinase [Bacteroidetes bacterium]|nr:acetylglutamate kinase [Bacteroidota bacterium]
MDKPLLYIIKVGGHLIDDPTGLDNFLELFATLPKSTNSGIPVYKLLVHGGGKMATQVGQQLGVPAQLIDGRRITDTETLKVVTMVYGGLLNKQLVAQLQQLGCNALGLTGADGNSLLAHKRTNAEIDYGWVGDIDQVNTALFNLLITAGLAPVVAPLTHDGRGHLLNTNADTMAQELAVALSGSFTTSLLFTFEKEGVLTDLAQPDSVLSSIDAKAYQHLKSTGSIFAGMIPKLDNAFKALEKGVSRVLIGKAEKLHDLIQGKAGTTLVK